MSATTRLPSGATTRKRGWLSRAATAGAAVTAEAGAARSGHRGDHPGVEADLAGCGCWHCRRRRRGPGCRRPRRGACRGRARGGGAAVPERTRPGPLPATTVTTPVAGSRRLIWWWPVSVNQMVPAAVDGGGAGSRQLRPPARPGVRPTPTPAMVVMIGRVRPPEAGASKPTSGQADAIDRRPPAGAAGVGARGSDGVGSWESTRRGYPKKPGYASRLKDSRCPFWAPSDPLGFSRRLAALSPYSSRTTTMAPGRNRGPSRGADKGPRPRGVRL